MNENNQSFWDHLEDLRKTLIRMGLIILAAFFVCLLFYKPIMGVLTAPLNTKEKNAITHQVLQIEKITNTSSLNLSYRLPDDARIVEPEENLLRKLDDKTIEVLPGSSLIIEAPAHRKLAILSPKEGFIFSFKIIFWLGLVVSSPFWLNILIHFVNPALKEIEKKTLLPFIVLSYLAIGFGITFTYFLTIPIANHYLNQFNEPIGFNFWAMEEYLDFTLLLLLSHGFAFEVLIILFILIHFGFVSSQKLTKTRRYVIVGVFIISAILTPSDVITQILMATPLMGFYELAILYAKSREQKFIRAKEAISL